ncbi:MAG TPA: tRNA (adenosine(37)-N6)-threonylcarbamoyltransferase complex ATPase subunit type 1 TsaE, partial [Chitinophagales bacterium]|nr:tRNA (adenosine(37)-N6)-threonylcarbamoyltransferase complex ATPase subunit type 1 TsaE [Chitinophagales bacterium]
NEYTIPTGKIYHMDCYRLKNSGEALGIGIEDYLNSDSYCFIEWPELIEQFLPADVIKISIRTEGNIRNVSIFKD